MLTQHNSDSILDTIKTLLEPEPKYAILRTFSSSLSLSKGSYPLQSLTQVLESVSGHLCAGKAKAQSPTFGQNLFATTTKGFHPQLTWHQQPPLRAYTLSTLPLLQASVSWNLHFLPPMNPYQPFLPYLNFHTICSLLTRAIYIIRHTLTSGFYANPSITYHLSNHCAYYKIYSTSTSA